MSKRKVIKLTLAIIFFLVGVFLFIYPRVTDNIYKSKIKSLESEYIKTIEINKDIPEEDNKLNELYNLLKDENNRLYQDRQVNFLNEKTYDINNIDLAKYGLKNNIFGFLELPSINIVLPIYLGSNEENMRLGATHLTGTSYPIGGINTNSVIAAHRGFYKTEMFRNIDKIKIGDKLYIKNFIDTLAYQAVKIDIIKPSELEKLTIQEGNDMITIISCHPFPYNYQRYIIYFKRV